MIKPFGHMIKTVPPITSEQLCYRTAMLIIRNKRYPSLLGRKAVTVQLGIGK